MRRRTLDLSRLSAGSMIDAIAAVRNLGGGARSEEEVSDRLAGCLHGSLVDGAGRRAVALVRCLVTRPYAALDHALRETLAPASRVPDTRCLLLLASRGQRLGSDGLSSPVVPLDGPPARRTPLLDAMVDAIGRTGVFHVPDVTAGPEGLSAEFVRLRGIRSLVGFGGRLPDGELLAVLVCSKVPIDRGSAELFRPLGVAATLAYAAIPQPPRAAAERSAWEATALRDLLSFYEHASSRVDAGPAADGPRMEEALPERERTYAEAYERERRAADELRLLDEMKNAFLTAVSHELRTPLTSILGYAKTLNARGESLTPDERREFSAKLIVKAEDLERLLGDILDLDRLGRGILAPRRRPTDLGALVKSLVARSDLLDGRAVSVDVEPVVVAVDAPKIERIVENLIANAGRHTAAGTPVWVRVAPSGGGAMISVEDAGPGVPPEEREAIFEPFKQGSDATDHSPGVGIGLSLVARFAELHGGRAWVEERSGGGAAFHVLLPRAEPTND